MLCGCTIWMMGRTKWLLYKSLGVAINHSHVLSTHCLHKYMKRNQLKKRFAQVQTQHIDAAPEDLHLNMRYFKCLLSYKPHTRHTHRRFAHRILQTYTLDIHHTPQRATKSNIK